MRLTTHIPKGGAMKPTTHIRKGREIRSADPKDAKMYESINRAKKASFAIQMKADKALGRGTVKVILFTARKRRRKQAGKFNVK
jgi:hypothetical protein